MKIIKSTTTASGLEVTQQRKPISIVLAQIVFFIMGISSLQIGIKLSYEYFSGLLHLLPIASIFTKLITATIYFSMLVGLEKRKQSARWGVFIFLLLLLFSFVIYNSQPRFNIANSGLLGAKTADIFIFIILLFWLYVVAISKKVRCYFNEKHATLFGNNSDSISQK